MEAKVKSITYKYLNGTELKEYCAPYADIRIDHKKAYGTSIITIDEEYKEIFFIVAQNNGTFKKFDNANDAMVNARNSKNLPFVVLAENPTNMWFWCTFYSYEYDGQKVRC